MTSFPSPEPPFPGVAEGERKLHVNIGEAKAGREGDSLRATLGSCVGIVLLWREKGRAALAHCLLPSAPEAPSGAKGKYVENAVPLLLGLLRAEPGATEGIEAVLVGGGEMCQGTPGTKSIGAHNIEAARAVLGRAGIPIVHEEVGGKAGRQVAIACGTGRFRVHSLPKI